MRLAASPVPVSSSSDSLTSPPSASFDDGDHAVGFTAPEARGTAERTATFGEPADGGWTRGRPLRTWTDGTKSSYCTAPPRGPSGYRTRQTAPGAPNLRDAAGEDHRQTCRCARGPGTGAVAGYASCDAERGVGLPFRGGPPCESKTSRGKTPRCTAPWPTRRSVSALRTCRTSLAVRAWTSIGRGPPSTVCCTASPRSCTRGPTPVPPISDRPTSWRRGPEARQRGQDRLGVEPDP